MDQGYLRIGELSERVGVSPDLLRAWERRYGLLSPDRSKGGFRLYSDADIGRVGLMLRNLDQGLAAAQAARLALSDHDVGMDRPTSPGRPTTAGRPDPDGDQRLSTADGVERLTRALDDFDEVAAHHVLDGLLGALQLETVLREVIMPYLLRLGERWATGEVTIAQEHFASSFVHGRLFGLARGWGSGVGPVAALAAPPDENHELALVVFGIALWRRGWRIAYLGADTPVDALWHTVDSVRPDLLVLAATRPSVLLAIEPDLAALADHVPLALGGEGVSPQLANRVGARHLTGDPVSAADRIAIDA